MVNCPFITFSPSMPCVREVAKVTTAFSGVMNHPPPSLLNHSTECHFTWCLLWALNVVHLKRRLRIIQWQHVAPFSPQKEQELVDGDHNCATCGSLWRARRGLLNVLCALRLKLWSEAEGKCCLIKGLAKTKATMPQLLRRPSPTLRSQMVCVCLFLLKVN